MNLQELKKTPFDLIVSLGENCDPAGHLRRHNLRKFSMPLDWVVSVPTSDVCQLLRNRFVGYMELSTMIQIDGSASYVEEEQVVQLSKSYFIRDTCYNIISVHDFPVIAGQDWQSTYPSYKSKLTTRVNRFLEKITHSKSILFVRLSANYDQTVELGNTLNEIVSEATFKLLIINQIADCFRSCG